MSERSPSAPLPDGRVRLAIHRMAEESSFRFLFLVSHPIPGFGTHWRGGKDGKGYYCPGADCPDCAAEKPRVWKGYVPVLRYCRHAKTWTPCVLEVTESLELDLRDTVQRGQIWEVSRGKKIRKGRPPCIGRLADSVPLDKIPPAFPVLDCVRWTYHDYAIQIGEHSKIPMRALVSPITFDTAQPEAKKDPAEFKRFVDHFMQGGRKPVAANGAAEKGGV